MSARQSIIVQGVHGGIVVAAILAVTILGYHGTIDGESVVAVLGAAIGFAGANATSIGSLAQAVNGKAVIPAHNLAEREATLRTAMIASAASSPHTVEAVKVVDDPEGD